MLASLPKLADKNFVIGFLLPVLIGGLALAFLFRDTDAGDAVYKLVLGEKSLSDLTVAVVGVWCCAVVLMILNYHVYRLLEGYVWPMKRACWRLKQVATHEAALTYLTGLHGQIFPRPGTAAADVQREYFRRRRDFNMRFPRQPDHVLPTRFGNVIRAFETYPYRVYGADSIPVWLRLQGSMPKDFTALIADTRAQVDFFLNILVLSCLLGIVAVVRAVLNIAIWQYCTSNGLAGLMTCNAHAWHDVHLRYEFVVVALIAFALARLCYELAIARAVAWGGMVKSAFDLYLPDLARQLGYALPATDARRRDFWDAVNSLFLYGTPIPDEWPRADTAAAPAVAAAPDDADDDTDQD
jgi:hypothetical protein